MSMFLFSKYLFFIPKYNPFSISILWFLQVNFQPALLLSINIDSLFNSFVKLISGSKWNLNSKLLDLKFFNLINLSYPSILKLSW